MKISIKIKFSVFLAVLLLLTVVILSILVLDGIKKDQQEQYEGFLAQQISSVSGQLTVLYDKDGKKVGESVAESKTDNFKTTLSFALKNKIAYQVEQDSLYYYSFANGILKLKNVTDLIRTGEYNIEVPHRRDELGKLGEGIYDMSRQIVKTIGDMQAEQQKLTLAVAKLSELEQQQKQFIGNVTHEFKTPLTSVKAYIDLLEMYPDDMELMKTARETIDQEIRRLYEMVDKVLQLSALEKYDFEYNMEKIDVREIILQVCSSIKGRMDKFGLLLETELEEVFVEADRENMIIILINLLDNAIKYNKSQGSIRIRSHEAYSKVFIDISDTGIGMPAEAEFKIFEPFYTVDKNRSRLRTIHHKKTC